nr:hypothetical protein [Tanacetum cinerariifolium]
MQKGHTQEEGIDYEKVFAPVARIKAIRLFLAYASFVGFMVYKVVKALYGLHQAPSAWYEALANYLLENGFQRGKIDQILFIQKKKGDILLVQVYVDDIIFGSTNKELYGKSASTPIDTEKSLLKDPDGEDVDTVVANSSTEAEYVAVVSCCTQVLWIQNQLLDYGLILTAVSSKLMLFGLTIDVAHLMLLGHKYTSPVLTQKVFSNMRRIGKRFSGVDTPLFDEKCATLIKQVTNLEQDKIAQVIKIIKLKQKVRRLEKKSQFKNSGLRRSRKVATTQRVESSCDHEDASKQGGIAKLYADEYVTLKEVDAKVTMDVEDTDEVEPAKVEEVIEVVTTAKLMTDVITTAATPITAAQVPKASALRRRRGVIIQDPKETATASVIVHSEAKSKDKGKVKRKEKQDNTVMRYQALKRKPITEAQARKNMKIYLKNMARFKMDFFRGMNYNEIRPIFEKYYSLNQAFLERVEEEVTGQDKEGCKRKDDSLKQRAAKKQRINEETVELKTHLQIIANDDDDVYTEATPLALKNFDKEDLEMLWKLVQERFKSSEPKNFSDDFLLNTFKIMFEKPNVEASIRRDQRCIYGLAKFKS